MGEHALVSATCHACGVVFSARRVTAKFCSKACRQSRAPKRPLFAAFDGEGVTVDGEHRYVLISVGDESYHRDGEHLLWWECLEFMHDKAYGRTLVGFYLGYDFTQIFRTIGEGRARALFTQDGIDARSTAHSPRPVSAKAPDGTLWEIDLLGMKRLRFRPRGREWVYVCDTGPFFQASFMSVIDPGAWPNPVVSEEDYAIIREGKARRSTAGFDRSMIRYNLAENRALESVLGELDNGLRSIGIHLPGHKYFGPGQAASEYLRMLGSPDNETIVAVTPVPVLERAIQSYYGGWFETFYVGHVGTLHENDINSAYPFAISSLPCLLHGEWRRGVDGDLTLITGTVEGSDSPIGPAPCRKADGRVYRPQTVTGTYWRHELDAACAAGLVSRITVDDAWAYHACPCPPPLRDIKALYALRQSVGKNTPQGKAIKIVLNSLYGKFAQSIGSPRWANPIYASLITSRTRTMILEAIATHPHGASAVAMVATDGIYFTSPHPSLDTDPTRLGAWDSKTLPGMTLLMPGVYWGDAARERVREGKTAKLKSRGINASALSESIGEIDRAFDAWVPGDPFPSFTIRSDFSMVSPPLALARGKWETCGLVAPAEREVSSDPSSKRLPPGEHDGTGWSTRRYPDAVVSLPYQSRFGVDVPVFDGPNLETQIGEILYG